MRTSTTRGRTGFLGGRFAAAGLALTATVTLLSDPAVAGPVGQEVVIGDVTFSQNGSHWVITASDGSIIDYVSFDILSHESVQFIQPGEFARVLNRIESAVPTQILGTLSANGIVYFVNPSGVIFGDGATINAAGLVAAAGHITNEDFLAGEDRFTGLSGEVENHGAITTNGGTTALLGSRVLNAGSISADGGMIAMVAGDSVWLRTIDGKLAVRVDGKDITGGTVPWAGTLTGAGTGVENTGTIQAAGGQVVLGAGDVAGLAVRNAGSIVAPGGEVTMAATQGVVRNEGLVDVSGPTGGDVTLRGPAVENLGTIKADGTQVRAGTVVLNGRQYTVLFPGSLVSARGLGAAAAGGKVVVNTNDGASLLADGATIDVRGAQSGGAGGDIEFGGVGMALQGTIRLGGGTGATPGTFMFLGSVIDVGLGGDNTEFDDLIADGQVTLEELAELSGVTEVFISANTLFNASGQILIQASGDIFLVSNVQFDPDANVDLVLEANQDVDFRQFTILGADSIDATAGLDGSGNGTIEINMALSAEQSIRLTGDLIRLDGADLSVAASDGSIELAGQASLLSDVTMTAGSVGLAGGNGNDGNDLTIDAGSTTIGGDWSGLGTFDVGGDTTLGAGVDVEGEQVLLGGDVLLDGDARLAAAELLRLDGDVVVADNGFALELSTDAMIELNGSITNGLFDPKQLGSLLVDGDVTFGSPNGTLIRTSGSQTWNGNLTLTRDLNVFADNATFNGAINALVAPPEGDGPEVRGGLFVDADTTTFSGPVGDQENGFLRRLQVQGETTLAGGLVRTRDGQLYDGRVTVLGGNELTSVDGGEIAFRDEVVAGIQEGGGNELFVNTSGTTRFDGTVSGLDRLETDAPGRTVAGADISANFVTVRDRLELDSDVTVAGGTRVQLLGGGVGNGHSLFVQAPNGTLAGAADGFTGFDQLEAGGGTMELSGTIDAGSVRFLDDVLLDGDAFIRGAQLVHFGGNIAGSFDLEIESDELVEFIGNVGSSFFGPLASLTVTVDEDGSITDQNLIVFGPDSAIVAVDGTISLNENRVVDGSQLVASIASFDALTLRSLNGDVRLGRNEKLTVLGGLTFDAQNGTVVFGDLTVVDSLVVDAQAIEIWAREAGQYLAADGTLQDDSGTDILVGGTVTLGATPTSVPLVDGAPDPVFAVATPQEIANLGDLEVVEIDPFTAADLQMMGAGAGKDPGFATVLDGGVLVEMDDDGDDGDNGGGDNGGGPVDPEPEPEPDQFEGTLAEFTGEEIRRRRGEIQEVRVNRDPVAQETLQRLALIIRSLRPEELRTVPEGRLLTVDVADPAILRGETPPTSGARVSRDALATAGERIERLLGPAEGEVDPDAAAVEIRESLLRAWAIWRAEDGDAGSPAEFAAWLETAGEDQTAARFAVESLRDVAASVTAMGLTRAERDAAIRPLIRAVAPAILGEAFVFDLVMGG